MKIFISIAIVWLSLFTPLAGAEWKKKTYTVSVLHNARPYMWEEYGLAVGADPDFIREIGRRIGVSFVFKPMPMKRALFSLKNGDVDFGVGYKTEGRKRFVRYLGEHPLHWAIYPLFVRKGGDFPFNKLEDLYGKKIGKNRSFSISNEFDDAVKAKKIKVVEIEGYSSMVKLLLNGRVDGILGNPSGIVSAYSRIVHTEEMYPLERLVSPLKGSYLVMSKKADIPEREALIEKIEKAIVEIVEDGTVLEIEKRFSGFTYNPSINMFGSFSERNTGASEFYDSKSDEDRLEGVIE
ncbi:MAG: ABC transporter substrate-binding protein [Agarilytica sp.]